MEKTEKRRAWIIRVGYFALIGAGAWLAIRLLFGAAVPFLIAFTVAWLLQKPIEWFSRTTRLPQKAAAVLVTLLGLVLLVGVLAGVCLLLGSGAAALLGRVPDFIENTLPALRRGMDELLAGALSALPDGIAELCADWGDGLIGSIRDAALSISASLLASIGRMAARLPGLLLHVVVTITATFFITMDYRRIVGFIRRQLPRGVQKIISSVREAFSLTVGRLCGAYLKLCALNFAVLAVLLYFFVRAEGGIMLAAMIAVLDMLPVLGCGTVLLPWAIGCALTGDGMGALQIGITYAIVILVRGVAEPKLVGASVGLHPVAALLSMCIGLHTFGFIGMILLPVAAMILKQMQQTGTLRLWK